MKRLIVTLSVAAITALQLTAPAEAFPASCHAGSASAASGVLVYGTCAAAQTETGSAALLTRHTETRTITCGYPSSLDNEFWKAQCGTMMRCPKGPAFATQIQQNGQWVLLNTWCVGDAVKAPARAVTTAALREQALRLLPAVRIGSAWTTRALVNAEAILWAETAAHRSLGAVRVVGRQVALRIGFDHANWTFGDSATDTASEPGKPYTKSDPCETAQCADYYGHTYTDTGDVTITLTVAWHAEFSLDNGSTWTAVDPAPLTGPVTTHDLTVVQARGILVQDP